MEFRTSSYSRGNSNCVEFATSSYSGANGDCVQFGKSSYSSGNANCAEFAASAATLEEAREAGVREEVLAHVKVQSAVAAGEKLYMLRDSKNPDGATLAFTRGEWDAFLKGAKDGEFDL